MKKLIYLLLIIIILGTNFSFANAQQFQFGIGGGARYCFSSEPNCRAGRTNYIASGATSAGQCIPANPQCTTVTNPASLAPRTDTTNNVRACYVRRLDSDQAIACYDTVDRCVDAIRWCKSQSNCQLLTPENCYFETTDPNATTGMWLYVKRIGGNLAIGSHTTYQSCQNAYNDCNQSDGCNPAGTCKGYIRINTGNPANPSPTGSGTDDTDPSGTPPTTPTPNPDPTILGEDGPGEAQEINERLRNPLQSTTFIELIDRLLTALIYIAIPIAVVALVYTGFKFVMSQGNEKELTDAKRNLKYVLIGITIIISARVIIAIIRTTLESLN